MNHCPGCSCHVIVACQHCYCMGGSNGGTTAGPPRVMCCKCGDRHGSGNYTYSFTNHAAAVSNILTYEWPNTTGGNSR